MSNILKTFSALGPTVAAVNADVAIMLSRSPESLCEPIRRFLRMIATSALTAATVGPNALNVLSMLLMCSVPARAHVSHRFLTIGLTTHMYADSRVH